MIKKKVCYQVNQEAQDKMPQFTQLLWQILSMDDAELLQLGKKANEGKATEKELELPNHNHES